MRDPAKLQEQVLYKILEASSRQLEESNKNIEDAKSILPSAKTLRDRTTMNILLDYQRKVVKALERLISDISEIVEKQ